MYGSLRRLASSSAPLPLTVSQASAQLIPPIPLYRRLLRAHRSLPDDMRFMGDSYIKSEFRLTRSTDNPLHIIGFLSQWKSYLDELESSGPLGRSTSGGEAGSDVGSSGAWRGRKLDTELFEKMSKEQVGQLYELMHATKDLWKSPQQLEQDAQQAEVAAEKPGS